MIDWLVNKLFWWAPLREAIFAEVHFYDQIDEAMKEPASNLTWCEDDGLWRGWTFSDEDNMYIFDDTGYASMVDLWSNSLLRQPENVAQLSLFKQGEM
jgi:hypothetical protein